MKKKTSDPNERSCKIDDPVQVQFFRNAKFCLSAQEYLQNLLSVQIAIIPCRPVNKSWNMEKVSNAYRIHVIDTEENQAKFKQILSKAIQNLFETVQSQTFTNDKVKEWLENTSIKGDHLSCLQKLIDAKIPHLFTVCQENPKRSLKIYYFAQELSSVANIEELNKLIESKIAQETILLPFRCDHSRRMKNELDQLIAQAKATENISVSFSYNNSSRKTFQTKIIMFGDQITVNRLKKTLLEVIARCNVTIYQIDSLNTQQIEFLLKTCRKDLMDIEEKYEQFAVEIRLRLKEFSAPPHLKEEIESSITQLLSNSKTITFKSIALPKAMAQIAEKHLKSIAQKNHCCLITELRSKSQCYTIPKAQMYNTQVSFADDFLFSPDLSMKIVVVNGSIDIRIGDIALQKVESIIIPMTTNGLKEGVIERAGVFDYEHTYTITRELKLTETNGGQLSCKRILFSNWTPVTLINDENELRNSIRIFVSKSIEYIIKDRNTRSMAFAVSNLCTDEKILAEEMISTVKQQLQAKKLQLNVSLILLPEQQTLFRQFSTLLGDEKEVCIQLDWPISIIKTTIIASTDDDLRKCQMKINNSFKQCITSMKLVNSNGVFQHWNQHTINIFYKYCHDQCLLPQLDQTGKILELVGFVNRIHEAREKWQVLSDLITEKTLRTSTVASLNSARVITYNLMVSYCQEDTRKCQKLIKRFIDENLSVWGEAIVDHQPRDTSSQMNNSECILLCISENYYESQSCEKEARYAIQTGKPIFLVKIRNDPLFGWQREIFQDKLIFPLFGSEYYCNLQYDHLLLKILRSIRPNNLSMQQQKSARLQSSSDETRGISTVEQLRSKYDTKIKALMQIGHIEEEEMVKLTEQLQNVIDDTDPEKTELDEENREIETDHQDNRKNKGGEYGWIERWLKKANNTTKQNLPPFTVSGDINDAIFPMPEYILQQMGVEDRLLFSTQSSSIKVRHLFERDIIKRPVARLSSRDLWNEFPVDDEYTYGKCTGKIQSIDGISQVFTNCHPCIDQVTQNEKRLPCLPPELSNDSKNKKHAKSPGGQEESVQYTAKNYQRPTRAELDVYFQQFASRMQKNAIEFERFCASSTEQQISRKEQQQRALS